MKAEGRGLIECLSRNLPSQNSQSPGPDLKQTSPEYDSDFTWFGSETAVMFCLEEELSNVL